MENEIERINLDDYVQTGEGGTALTYTHKNGRRLAKLYNAGFEADWATEEFQNSRVAYELGIPTPEPYRLVTDGVRCGAEYELISNKRSFARIISQEPERLEELSVVFARMARELHARQADTARMVSVKERVRRYYLEHDVAPDSFKALALQFIDQVPEATTCLHSDLHVGNVITDGVRTLWIDLGKLAYGVPEWDLGMYFATTNRIQAEMADFLFHLKPETLAAHWNVFFPAYLETTDPQRIAAATKSLLPFMAVKVPIAYFAGLHKRMPEDRLQGLAKMLADTLAGGAGVCSVYKTVNGE